MGVERKHMGDILVGSHDDHAAAIAIDAAHVENVVAAFQIRAEHFLVVAEPVTAFAGEKKLRHGLEGQRAMALLEHSPDIDHGVDIGCCRRIFANGRLHGVGKESRTAL